MSNLISDKKNFSQVFRVGPPLSFASNKKKLHYMQSEIGLCLKCIEHFLSNKGRNLNFEVRNSVENVFLKH